MTAKSWMELLNLPGQLIPLDIIPIEYPAERKMPNPDDESRERC
jgi:hypothetical protein